MSFKSFISHDKICKVGELALWASKIFESTFINEGNDEKGLNILAENGVIN